MRAVARILLLGAVALVASGCFTRPYYDEVFSKNRTTLKLRSYVKGRTTVEKGYEHPFTISPVRAAHILSRIDIRKEGSGKTDRVPAIPTESLYLVGEALAAGFAKADANQELVVLSIRRGKRLGIFDRKYLTSFVAYRRGDLLYLHLAHSDWEIPTHMQKDNKTTNSARVPLPQVGESYGKGRVIASEAMTVVDAKAVAVAWRDPIFARATRTRITPGGRVVRRTILMEEPDSAPAAAETSIPTNVSGDTLRKLADLEDARRRGEISEGDYSVRRQQILESDPGKP